VPASNPDGGGAGSAGGSSGTGGATGAGGGGGNAGGGSAGAGGGSAGTGMGSAGTGGGGATGTGGGAAGVSGTGGGGGCPGFAFCDDFEDGDAAGWAPIGGTWSIVNDGGSVYRGANGSGNAIAGAPTWTDQTVEARVKVTQFGNNKPGFRAGVIARYANATTFYVFLLDGSGALRLLVNDEMPAGRTGTCGKIDANPTAGAWHALKLQVSGANPVRLQTFLDGAAVHDCTSTSGTVAAGSAGAYVYGANTIVEFDDVRVATP
jgi:pectate lyase